MSTGELVTRWTIRLALALYVVALGSLLAGRPHLTRQARRAWTAGCVLLLLHVLAAFHFFHHWRHAEAYRDTARQTAELLGVEFGGGLWFNYAFAACWTLDALWWWSAGMDRYRLRSAWITWSVHLFMAFIALNATVVFETGPTCWLSLAAVIVLVAIWLRQTPAGSSGR